MLQRLLWMRPRLFTLLQTITPQFGTQVNYTSCVPGCQSSYNRAEDIPFQRVSSVFTLFQIKKHPGLVERRFLHFLMSLSFRQIIPWRVASALPTCSCSQYCLRISTHAASSRTWIEVSLGLSVGRPIFFCLGKPLTSLLWPKTILTLCSPNVKPIYTRKQRIPTSTGILCFQSIRIKNPSEPFANREDWKMVRIIRIWWA